MKNSIFKLLQQKKNKKNPSKVTPKYFSIFGFATKKSTSEILGTNWANACYCLWQMRESQIFYVYTFWIIVQLLFRFAVFAVSCFFFPVRHAKNCFRTFFGLKIIALALALTDNNDSMPFLRGESERSIRPAIKFSPSPGELQNYIFYYYCQKYMLGIENIIPREEK